MNGRGQLFTRTAGATVLAALLLQLGCLAPGGSTSNPTPNQSSTPGTGTGSEGGETPPGTEGGETKPAEPTEPTNPAEPTSPGEFADIHWWTPSCPSGVCYDTKLSSDGTYQKQRIVMSANNKLFCEHGTWKQVGGKIEFVPAAKCANLTPYEQTWSQSDGVFVLQGVKHQEDSYGTFNCGPTDC